MSERFKNTPDTILENIPENLRLKGGSSALYLPDSVNRNINGRPNMATADEYLKTVNDFLEAIAKEGGKILAISPIFVKSESLIADQERKYLVIVDKQED
jgi:hypothetical protein